MSTFREADHPRGGNPGNPGQFSAKTHKEAECSLDDYDPLAGLNVGERRNLAKDPNTPAEILARLSEDGHRWVRRGVAYNSNTPTEVLVRLSGDEDSDVRDWVARNPNAPATALTRLSEDKDRWVRWDVAGNPHAPAETLTRLSGDENPDVRRIARRALQARANAG